MNRKRNVFFILLVILFICSGCSLEKKVDEKENIKDEKVIVDKSVKEDIPSVNESKKISVYFVDGDTGEMTTKSLDWVEGDYGLIWKELQNSGILTEDCGINQFNENEEDKSLLLDVNKGFGERIRSMGTTGETEILSCVVNTYLEAYGCEKMKLTEDGQILETGHASLEGYISKY